jgi:DNA-binding LytR/AlgR family response regulator
MAELHQIVRNLRSTGRSEPDNAFETEFWLRGAAGLVRVPVETIDCISSEDEYVAIHTIGGSHLMRSSIRQFEQKVEPDLFVRVHRRWLVRKAAIVELRTPRFGKPEVVLRNGKRLPAGRVYLKQLRQSVCAPAAEPTVQPAASASRF